MKLHVALSMVLLICSLVMSAPTRAAAAEPLKVALAGLVHGHADGFFSSIAKRTDVQIVGIAEADKSVFDQYAKEFHLDASLYHASLDELLNTTKPQVVLAYSNTADHLKDCARSARRTTSR